MSDVQHFIDGKAVDGTSGRWGDVFNPATGLVHVAIGEPGLVETIDPRSGASERTATGAGAHTTAIVVPDRLYVISPSHGGVLVLADT